MLACIPCAGIAGVWFNGPHGLRHYFDIEDMEKDMIEAGLPEFTKITAYRNIYDDILDPGRWPREGGGKSNLLSETVKPRRNRSESCDPESCVLF